MPLMHGVMRLPLIRYYHTTDAAACCRYAVMLKDDDALAYALACCRAYMRACLSATRAPYASY